MEKSESRRYIRKVAQAGVFTALAVAVGYLLFYIPNIELVSCTIFAAGWLFGTAVGIVVGGISYAIFSIFNPLGASLPPLFIAQVLGGVLTGLAGGLLRHLISSFPLFLKVIMLGIVGGIITLIYDVITNMGGFIAFTTGKTFFAYLATGIIFSLVHILSNVLIFAVLLYPVLTKAETIVVRES
jgi:uncharacterized membrane protein